jgi:NAD(P)H-flavin reductase/hemoglobin-like flavoprotein
LFAALEPQSRRLMARFFARLFVHEPTMRGMFPLAMGALRAQVFDALVRVARDWDDAEALASWLGELALDHRKYGVTEQHYQAFFDNLIAMVAMFGDSRWTPATQQVMTAALNHVHHVMTDATRKAQDQPPWWLADVVDHERRRPDLAVLTLRVAGQTPLDYRPGQHVSISSPRLPRLWREYSIASAGPSRDILKLHVRAIPGGALSGTLVRYTQVGDTLIVGRARGAMTVDALTNGSVLAIAGGTGLAPIKSIVEALASAGPSQPCPVVTVLLGARIEADLYDLAEMTELAQRSPFLQVVPVIGPGPDQVGPGSALTEAVLRHLPPGACDVLVCGPAGMVRTVSRLAAEHCPLARVLTDPLPPDGRPARRQARGETAVPSTDRRGRHELAGTDPPRHTCLPAGNSGTHPSTPPRHACPPPGNDSSRGGAGHYDRGA